VALHPVDSPIRPSIVLQLVVLLGVEDVLRGPAEGLERDEQLLVAPRRAVAVLLGLELKERRGNPGDLAER
jgi:hypothetical protein